MSFISKSSFRIQGAIVDHRIPKPTQLTNEKWRQQKDQESVYLWHRLIYADLRVVIFVASIFIAWTRCAGSTNGSTQLVQVAERSTAVYPFHLENVHQDSWERVQGAQKRSLSFTTVSLLGSNDVCIWLHDTAASKMPKRVLKTPGQGAVQSTQAFLAPDISGDLPGRWMCSRGGLH